MRSHKETYRLKLYGGKYFYAIGFLFVVLFTVTFFIPFLFQVVLIGFFVFLALSVVDLILLRWVAKMPVINRELPELLSNGDENPVKLYLRNRKPFKLYAQVYDGLPVQFQERDFVMQVTLHPGVTEQLKYTIRPTSRGVYEFGDVYVFFLTAFGLIKLLQIVPQQMEAQVYPSFLHMRKYRLIADGRMQESGGKRMRKIGHSMEFDQIKEYVSGDDIRSINWKATARKQMLMVNKYEDERAQQVYCIIDKGRLMRSPFKGLTLLDYAINSTLVISDVSLRKQDKVGLVTFAQEVDTFIPADRKAIQGKRIMEALYKIDTVFPESSIEELYLQLHQRIRQRSFLILYTNFDSMTGLKRQLQSLIALSKNHLLLVVLFENTELFTLSRSASENIEDVYIRTIAEKFLYEKKMILKELGKYGIHTLLVQPEQLSIRMLNKYLEFKNRQAI